MAVTTQTATFQTLCLKRNSQISSEEFRPQKERWRKCEKHSKFLCGEYHHSLTAVAPPRSNNIQVGSFQVRSCCTGDWRVAIKLMKMAQTEVKFKHFARRSVCWKCSVIFTAVGLRLDAFGQYFYITVLKAQLEPQNIRSQKEFEWRKPDTALTGTDDVKRDKSASLNTFYFCPF